ncbi:MAG: STAS domain-containing protein [Candidatus Eisenbacteria bacterium]|uniref:STAS domain-containing protein n=1 Tax=Eiseniibacteriota bacterium TaxID=2212470 RepID=A0A849SI30_UNCEI|nr:STAS domain-containing protein [Candidatus Eisenbacteria bacterium]
MIPARLIPKSIQCLRGYDARTFLSDLVAGVTVGLVALPLAMAFAISSGLPPQAGLTCAVVAGFLISALGGSRVQIGGPTGAFVVVVAGIVAHHGVDGLFMCTMMAGVMLVLLGVSGFGTAVDFIPRPVIVGFTNGIAVLIASTQIRDFLGLRIPHASGEFVSRMREIGAALPSWNPTALALGAAALLVIVVMRIWVPRVPGTIVALIGGTAVAAGAAWSIETIGSRFGGIPSGWPPLVVPQFRADLITPLLGPAVTVAMLGAIESLLSAVVADRMTGDRHEPNTELVAQGVANIVSPLFGGLPATGAIARTATNIRSGGRTPVAGMIHALTVLGVLLFAASLARFVPLCILSAILFVVAWNMGDWAEIPEILKLSAADIAVWVVTFLLTVFADLTVAVQAGMILAALLFISRIAATTTVSRITTADIERDRRHSLQDKDLPHDVAIFRIHGPFLFGAAEKLNVIIDQIPELPERVILRLRNMTAIDSTGLRAIEQLAARLEASGRALIVEGMREQPARLMRRAQFAKHVGPDNVCDDIQGALARVAALRHPA